MILLSAHMDTVTGHPPYIELYDGKWCGLLDNFVGVAVVNALILGDENINRLIQEKKVGVFYGNSEEWGSIAPMPKVDKDDIVLVVDVASGERYDGRYAAIENLSGFEVGFDKELSQFLEWEGFPPVEVKKYTGEPGEEDESWYWEKRGIKTMSFTIPIEQGQRTGWHGQCEIDITRLYVAIYMLKRIINFLL